MADIFRTPHQVAARGEMKTQNLSNRWTDQGADVAKINKHTRHFAESPFGQTPAGSSDFRGLCFRGELTPCGSLPKEVQGADFSHCSFSHTAIIGWTFISCRFDKSQFKEAVRLEDCAFESCTFNGIHGGAFFPVRCQFNDCEFEDLKLSSKTAFIGCRIDGGRFTSKRLKIQFSNGTTIDRTAFSGELFECGFEGIAYSEIPRTPSGDLAPLRPELIHNRMRGVDFSNAAIRRCGFAYGVDLSEIIPPPETYNCVVRVNHEFSVALHSFIDSQFTAVDERELAHKLARMDYEEDPFNLFRVAHIDDELNFQGREFSARFFSCVCTAAEQTHTRIVGK